MKILLAGASLLPDYGGPAFSVCRLAAALSDLGVDVGLWASDQSAASTPLLSGFSAVQRLSGSASEAFEHFAGASVIHDNGIWLPHNHRLAELARKRRVPRVVSTRGMLQPWALAHKRWKKTVAWRLYQRRDLMRAQLHHATAEPEAQSLQRLKLAVPIRTIPNGVDLPDLIPRSCCAQHEPPGEEKPKIALFLGRIYPVKGLPMLIEAWARVRPEGWKLLIAGPDEAGHRLQVERSVAAADLSETVSFTGPVDERMKPALFSDADLFVLPSHSESYGIAAAEALAHGLPVLTTKGTPWSIVAEHDCGWWVDASVEGLSEGLRRATSRSRETLRAMGMRGRDFVATELGWRGVATQFMSLYEELLSASAASFPDRFGHCRSREP
jgi:glycosyltransferase involved in cell wall biosynthesis